MAVDETRRLVLHCYARPVDQDRHMAVCLTLNLVAQGRTQREALHKLHTLIKAYLADAIENNEFDEFVPRRAPARFYVEYVLCRAAHAVTGFISTQPSVCAFTDHHKIPAHA